MTPRTTLAALLPALVLPLASGACKKNEAAATDAGAPDAGAALAILDAGPAPLPDPSNQASIGRFGDETKLNDVTAKIADARVVARNSVPGGTVVANLRQGEEVVQIAQHDKFILCTFADPKSAGQRLEGWVAEEAFKPGPTAPLPKSASCPNAQVHLIVDEQPFCGNVCKEDKDCPASAPKCTGHANSYVDGKEGPAVTTCTIAWGATPVAPSAGPVTQAGVQVQPLSNGACLPGFIPGGDHLCHKICPKGNECPASASCSHTIAGSISACVAGH